MMKGYFKFPMINEKNIRIDSALIFGDITPEEDCVCGISYHVADSEVYCRYVDWWVVCNEKEKQEYLRSSNGVGD